MLPGVHRGLPSYRSVMRWMCVCRKVPYDLVISPSSRKDG